MPEDFAKTNSSPFGCGNPNLPRSFAQNCWPCRCIAHLRVYQQWLGDVGGSLASPTADRVHFHYGGGALYWNNGGQGATGGYGSYGIDFFPLNPIIISTVAKVGGLGGEWYLDLRGTAGVSLGQIEAYVGYSHLSVAGVSLGGPLMGIRMWL